MRRVLLVAVLAALLVAPVAVPGRGRSAARCSNPSTSTRRTRTPRASTAGSTSAATAGEEVLAPASGTVTFAAPCRLRSQRSRSHQRWVCGDTDPSRLDRGRARSDRCRGSVRSGRSGRAETPRWTAPTSTSASASPPRRRAIGTRSPSCRRAGPRRPRPCRGPGRPGSAAAPSPAAPARRRACRLSSTAAPPSAAPPTEPSRGGGRARPGSRGARPSPIRRRQRPRPVSMFAPARRGRAPAARRTRRDSSSCGHAPPSRAWWRSASSPSCGAPARTPPRRRTTREPAPARRARRARRCVRGCAVGRRAR